jgi:hypothetical protein
MGSCCGSSNKEKIFMYEERLYALCMKYQFDLEENQSISFNELFRRENCNELGEQFNEQSAKVIIMEFRKFMFLIGAEMARLRRSTGYASLNPRTFNDGAKTIAYECPYNAPPYIDRVWRAMIAYSTKYKDICYKICYGYVLRKDPRQNPQASLERYNFCRIDCYQRRIKLYPFHNAWPQYSNENEYYNDFVYTVWASPTNVRNFTEYLGRVPLQEGMINAQMCISTSQKIKDDYQRQFPPECQGRPSYNANYVNPAPNIQHNYLNRQDPAFRATALQKLMAYTLPSRFEEFVSQEVMISIDQARDIIFEYRRFILMYGNTAYKLYPSEQIEKVWLIHMAHGTNYIKFCNDSIGIVPYHMPFTGNTTGYDDRNEYANTLSLYQAMFNEVPCTSVWAPVDFRFDVENFKCMFVNLIRLAGLYWANMQGHLKSQQELKPRGQNTNGVEHQEKKEKLKEKKKNKGNAGAAVAVGAGVGAGVILGAGGLALVANPNTVDYNDNDMMDGIMDGLHDGLSALDAISFGDMIDVGEGALGAFEDVDWPDIDMDGFGDMAGELFGDAGEFFADAGEGIVDIGEGAGEAIGDAFEGIGIWFD